MSGFIRLPNGQKFKIVKGREYEVKPNKVTSRRTDSGGNFYGITIRTNGITIQEIVIPENVSHFRLFATHSRLAFREFETDYNTKLIEPITIPAKIKYASLPASTKIANIEAFIGDSIKQLDLR